MSCLTCLVTLFLFVPSGDERSFDERVVVAVPGPLDAQAASMLPRLMDYYGDFGTLAIGEATSWQLQALERRGLTVRALGPWPVATELFVFRLPLPDLPDARTLFATHEQALVALPAGTHAPHGCHVAAPVLRTPAKPARPFSPPRRAVQAATALDDRITSLVAQVSTTQLRATVTQLSSYTTRRADLAEIHLAKDWLVAQLQAMGGLQVSTHTFNGTYAPNVVAEKTGLVHPDRIVVLGAHYDSINLSGSSLPAPGADDNASGSAGILEAARILSQQDFEDTVRLVWFSAEELGLIGSTAYAQSLLAEGVDVQAMLNLDMIAYVQAGDAVDLDFPTNNADPSLVQFCRDMTALYVPTLPTVTGILSAGTSDHQSFQTQGIPSAFLFEDISNFTPFIHSAGDTFGPSANSFGLAHDVTQVLVATAAALAGPLDLALTHTPLADTSDAGGPYALSVTATSWTAATVAGVEIHHRLDGGAWQVTGLLQSVDPGVWVGSLPGVAPTGTVDYFLVATDSDGHEQWLPEAFGPGNAFFTFLVGNATVVFADDFEGPGDNGWAHVQLATQDDWQRGAPQGKSGDPTAPWSGAAIWGNDLGPSGWNGSYQPNVSNYLESPAMDFSGQSDIHLRFRRWLTVEDGFYDQATIRVNGSVVWQNPATPGGGSANTLDTSWTLQDIDVSALADGNSAVRTRFELQSDGGLEFGGWNVDQLSLVSVGPGTVDSLVASVLYLSTGTGGTVDLALDGGPALGGRSYAIAMSATGTSPGTPLGSVIIPLQFDALTNLGFAVLGTPALPGFLGTLSPAGTASATFVVPPLPGQALEGLSIHFAWFTFGPVDSTSNPVTVTFQF